MSLATKIEAGFRCVRCGHPNGALLEAEHEAARTVEIMELAERWSVPVQSCRFYLDNFGRTWIRHYLVPCDDRCTHDPRVQDHRILTVHHLDGVKENLAWWNLCALDQRCHLEVQGRVRMEQAYLHPHTEWFRPYVAGYYAQAVLGLVLSRQEVEDRLAELLIAGQPHLEDFYREEVAA